MAWTQSDLDALEARIVSSRKIAQAGSMSVTDYDIEELLKLRDTMKSAIAGAETGSLSSSTRCTFASFSKE